MDAYEPNGNAPPDFLLKDGTAVEVTTIDQRYTDRVTGKLVSLSSAEVGLQRQIGQLLRSYRSEVTISSSYCITIVVDRPIPRARSLRKDLPAALDSFLTGSRAVPTWLKLPCGLRLRVTLDHKKLADPFRVIALMDEQRGGAIVQFMSLPVKDALRQKTDKTEPFRGCYDRWWLILVDEFGWLADEITRKQFAECNDFKHAFDRVLIVNALRPCDYFEL